MIDSANQAVKIVAINTVQLNFMFKQYDLSYSGVMMLFFCLFMQADTELMSRSVKVLGFEMKILISLVTDYSDQIGDCTQNIYNLILLIQRYCTILVTLWFHGVSYFFCY